MKDVLIAMGNAIGLLVSAGVLILYIYELFTGNIQHLGVKDIWISLLATITLIANYKYFKNIL